MCQLFGLNSAGPVTPNNLLRGFFQRGGGSDHHADGWGLAWYRGRRSRLEVRDTAAYQCRDAVRVLQRPFSSAHVIAHVRKATIGDVRITNSHPFVRRFWGRDWVFAHNGDLKEFHPVAAGPFHPNGDTDSERAFCFLLNSLVRRFGQTRPDTPTLIAHIQEVSYEIARHGICNYLLGDGELMLAYCTTDLYWAERHQDAVPERLVDIDSTASSLEGWSVPVALVATKPLTSGNVWYPMACGELRVFSQGAARDVLRGPVAVAEKAGPGERPMTGCTSGWDLDSMSVAW